MKTIGAIQYKDRGISIGVILQDGEKQAVAYGEGEDTASLKSELLTAFPEMYFYEDIVAFRKACAEIGANAWPEIQKQEAVVTLQKYAQWERVLWGEDTYALVESASLVAGGWMYHIITEKMDEKYTVAQVDLSKAEQVPPQKSVEVAAEHKVGEIVSWRGHQYKVVSYMFVSEQEAADMEDANDAYDMLGHHCRIRLVEA